ncbi:hypothetical protein DRE_05188 [Drechslerella stenobrocha 248]|uniref:Peptidyl-tRNA hydrolase n=1 Tax=Drechslerella stenobrocha 248 TaxID=1043628 RepID=W7HZI6_9PEZI|nr:hypothetical protein DRE_05188 [Drechslerella stenobrocha 248]
MGIKGRRRQRQRREQQQQHILDQNQHSSDETTCETAEFSPSSSSTSPLLSLPPPPPPPSPAVEMPIARHILLCAIGNPGALLATRHSAAHILLPHLASTPLSPSRRHGGPTATGPALETESLSYTTTIFQSTSFMNLSGPAVAKAWKTFKTSPGITPLNSLLVILHDELEVAVGRAKYKKGGSAGGHNGLSSIAASLPDVTIHKIGLGISRPKSHERDDVADYVLRPMPHKDVERMVETALPQVLEFLRRLGTGKLG